MERTTPRVSYVCLLTELPVQSNLMYVCLRIERLPVREGLQNKRGEGGLQNKGGEGEFTEQKGRGEFTEQKGRGGVYRTKEGEWNF